MRLLFSESRPDYDHYVFPYAVWAFPEPGETPADLFNQGFLPSTRALDRFYLCRHIRIDLRKFTLSSENRRILRKGAGIALRLVTRPAFEYTSQRRQFYKNYADVRFGKDVMSGERIDSLFQGKITSHVLIFDDVETRTEVGVATVYLEEPALAYYYYAFYDLNYYARNLGMFMMTSAVKFLAERGVDYLYLGSCYVPNALYKTQFAGAQFFNGVRWSENLKELKYLINRETHDHHLLEGKEYLDEFYEQGPSEIAANFAVRVPLAKCAQFGLRKDRLTGE